MDGSVKSIQGISVIITTRNRAPTLRGALQDILQQENEGVSHEVIIVDNNSTDETFEVVSSFQRHSPKLRYVFEEKVGISFGRNAGIQSSQFDIIAFTDDDVRVANDWLATIHRRLLADPEIDCVGGKVLPNWRTEPPRWLDKEHWWPLALVDWGDEAFYTNAERPLCLPTANCAFRREVFENLGDFSPSYSGREDHELFLRFWQAGRIGLYAPELVVYAEVQDERLSKSYHRNWNRVTGRANSKMRLDELLTSDGRLRKMEIPQTTLFGIPGFLYREFLIEGGRLLKSLIAGTEGRRLQHENRLCYLSSYMAQRHEEYVASPPHSRLTELGQFLAAIIRKKLRRGS